MEATGNFWPGENKIKILYGKRNACNDNAKQYSGLDLGTGKGC